MKYKNETRSSILDNYNNFSDEKKSDDYCNQLSYEYAHNVIINFKNDFNEFDLEEKFKILSRLLLITNKYDRNLSEMFFEYDIPELLIQIVTNLPMTKIEGDISNNVFLIISNILNSSDNEFEELLINNSFVSICYEYVICNISKNSVLTCISQLSENKEYCKIISERFSPTMLINIYANDNYFKECPLIIMNYITNKIYSSNVVCECLKNILPILNPLHYDYLLYAISIFISDNSLLAELTCLKEIEAFLKQTINMKNTDNLIRTVNILSLFYSEDNCQIDFDINKVMKLIYYKNMKLNIECLNLLQNFVDCEQRASLLIENNIFDLINEMICFGTYSQKYHNSLLLINVIIHCNKSMVKPYIFKFNVISNILSTIGFCYVESNITPFLFDSLLKISSVLETTEEINNFIQLINNSEFYDFVKFIESKGERYENEKCIIDWINNINII